jgi:RNA polymerase sigma-70 factor (ECF subfamily)
MYEITVPQQEAALDEIAADEARMLERARVDVAHFSPVYERYFPRIYNYCLRRVGHAQNAEDLTSLVFTNALTGLHGYRGGSVAAWLFRIAHNTVANHMRASRRQVTPVAPTSALEAIPEEGEDALALVLWAEERERITRLIATLPDEQRELLALRIAGELSAREIGAVLGKSEGAVRVALHRIVQQLRNAYRQIETEET